MDPLSHPDLASLGRRLRSRINETLDAEQHAARTAALRRRHLRDVLLMLEDRGDNVALGLVDGHRYVGRLEAVGTDHVQLDETTFVSIAHIVVVEKA